MGSSLQHRRLALYAVLISILLLCGVAYAAFGTDTPPAWLAATVTPIRTALTGEIHATPPPLDARLCRTYRDSLEMTSPNLALFRCINRHHHPCVDRLFLLISALGSGWIVAPVVGLVFLLRRRLVSPILLSLLLETAAVVLLKQWIDHPRPSLLLTDVHLLQELYKRTFPSGDTAMAFALAVPLALGIRRPAWRIALFAYALLIAYERVYLGVHFPLDVLVGAVIGSSAGITAHQLLRPRPQRTEVHA